MALYTDPKGRKLTDEAIARAWILANRAKAAKLIEVQPSRFPSGFGVVIEEDEDGTVTLVPE